MFLKMWPLRIHFGAGVCRKLTDEFERVVSDGE